MRGIIIPALLIAVSILACLHSARVILQGRGVELHYLAIGIFVIGLLNTVLWGHRLAREFFYLNN